MRESREVDAGMQSELEDVLERADRESRPVRLTFRDGAHATVRIRDLDRNKHHTITYMDMDGACGLRVARLEDIAGVEPQ